MKAGLVMLLAAVLVGAWTGVSFGKWLANENERDPSLGEPIYMGIGGILGAAAGLGIGLAIAYYIGRNQDRDR